MYYILLYIDNSDILAELSNTIRNLKVVLDSLNTDVTLIY